MRPTLSGHPPVPVPVPIRALQHNTVRPTLSIHPPVPIPVLWVLHVYKHNQSSTTQYSKTSTEWSPPCTCTSPNQSITTKYSETCTECSPPVPVPVPRVLCVHKHRALQQNTVRPALSGHPLYPYQSQGYCVSTNAINALQHNTVRPALSGHPLYPYQS